MEDLGRRLEVIQAITDEAFAHRDVDELLDTLLDRVRQILGTDTAVVLLLDRQERFLVASAAKGLEEEVNQGVHVPVGEGFAGRVAASRRPVLIEDVQDTDVFSPLLVQIGLRSLLGVPLLTGGVLLGVLHVGSFALRRFTPDETRFLQMAASLAAMAVQALRGRAEHAGALELQRSLVPTALPHVPGAELATRYRPGSADVGGDWYDAFPLPSGAFGIVMGDVVGHGLGAAVVMGRMRSALRSYALESDDPAEVLRRLDRKIQHFEPDATATVLYAVYDPALECVRMSSAGHCAPVLAMPGRPARALEMRPDALIGLDVDVPRRTVAVPFPPGTLLCFYTDGLVEHRDEQIGASVARLCEVVHSGPPEAVSAAVMAALVGRRPVEDDIALLLIRRTPAVGRSAD